MRFLPLSAYLGFFLALCVLVFVTPNYPLVPKIFIPIYLIYFMTVSWIIKCKKCGIRPMIHLFFWSLIAGPGWTRGNSFAFGGRCPKCGHDVFTGEKVNE